ncbi:hypothetical protein [Neorhodopirellula pilleata]|uniref:Uncharacterized protein n=1 Tax=Neorhodopirellula pilleata TaxID=2714738 RepID=A0A5C6ATT5_9BACT|nr:hypothetical protein [Neorhodopirellula pilleata]TWU03150.1 hypothetical protein Pla100_00680 [Neorhodopirellula pilleata]
MNRFHYLLATFLVSVAILGCGGSEPAVVTGHDVEAMMAEEAEAEASVAAAAAMGEMKAPQE